MEGESAYYAVDVDEAADILQLTPDRVREMLIDGDLEGIPPGGTVHGEWKVLLPATPDLKEPAPLEESPESPPEERDEPPPADEGSEVRDPPEEPGEPMLPPAVLEEARQLDDDPRGEDAATNREPTSESGWVTTRQAAKSLGISARTVRWHIERGNLEAKPEGQGVERKWNVSVDSIHAFRDSRQSAAPSPRGSRVPDISTDIAGERPGNAIRELADRLVEEARRAEAARVRLELSERAQSSLEAELSEERRRREDAERERDAARRELEALHQRRKESPQSPESPGPKESSTEEHGDPQEAREATQRAAETLRVPGAPKTATVEAHGGQPRPSTPTPQRPAQRRPWWRRRLGI